MIKKFFNKIKEMLFGRKIENCNTCPYKCEPKPIEEEKNNSIKDTAPTKPVIEEIETLECEHCKQELVGKESAEENGIKYIWCNKCNYVNKIKNGKVIRKENNKDEVMKAFKLFGLNGSNPSSYSYEESGSKHSF